MKNPNPPLKARVGETGDEFLRRIMAQQAKSAALLAEYERARGIMWRRSLLTLSETLCPPELRVRIEAELRKLEGGQ